MEVYLNTETRWEIDEEKIFTIYDEEWEAWKSVNGADMESQEKFVLDYLWSIAPHFEEIGGIETYDDARIDVFFLEKVKR